MSLLAGSPLNGPASSVFFVQNTGIFPASCTYTLYDAFGNLASSQSFSVGVDERKVVSIADTTGINPGTSGTGQVNCGYQPVAVVSLYSNPPVGGLNSSGAAFEGKGSPSGTWYAPENYNDYYGYSSHIVVYNTSGSTANASARFYDPSGNVVGDCGSAVPAHAAIMIEPRGCGTVTNNVNYSAVIYGSAGLVPVVNWYALNNPQSGSYSPVSAGSATVYIPYVMNNYLGFNTALTVQNVGSVPTDITVTYSGWGSETKRGIAPKAAALFFPPAPPANSPAWTSAWVTSSGQPLVAIENEGGPNNRAGSFTGFAGGTRTAYVPNMFYHFSGYNSSVTCQNVGSTATDLTITYLGTGKSATIANLQPLQSWPFYNADQFLEGWSGAAKVTSTYQPIACVVAIDQNDAPYSTTNMDQTYIYSAFSDQDTATPVYLPLLFSPSADARASEQNAEGNVNADNALRLQPWYGSYSGYAQNPSIGLPTMVLVRTRQYLCAWQTYNRDTGYYTTSCTPNWTNSQGRVIQPPVHVCTFDLATNDIIASNQWNTYPGFTCQDWVKGLAGQSQHTGLLWTIANEPEAGFLSGGEVQICYPEPTGNNPPQGLPANQVSHCPRLATMYNTMRNYIKGWDSSAKVLLPAWASTNVTDGPLMNNREGQFVTDYNDRVCATDPFGYYCSPPYGTLYAEGWGYHFYQYMGTGTNGTPPYLSWNDITVQEPFFANFLAAIPSTRATGTNQIYGTEIAWRWDEAWCPIVGAGDPSSPDYGNCGTQELSPRGKVPYNAPAIMAAFKYIYPFLKTRPEMVRWYYFNIYQQLLLDRYGSVNPPYGISNPSPYLLIPAGQCYRQLANQPWCFATYP